MKRPWHILDIRTTWVREFGCALACCVPTVVYLPEIRAFGRFQGWEHDQSVGAPPLDATCFPLQRMFARFPIDLLAAEHRRIVQRLLRRTDSPELSPLICSCPHYAAVAESWPGPVVYYVTDLFSAYEGMSWCWIEGLERRMCRRATLVCPNSTRIAAHLCQEAGCEPARIAIIPNATRHESLLPCPPQGPAPLPEDLRDMRRPVAGVIGNLAGNMDWDLLAHVVECTPWLSWVFVGPTSMRISDRTQRKARAELMASSGRARFVGAKPYGDLKHYARGFDVAILPYRKVEPTYSGSSTRFYEHLAASRPIISTRGFEELVHKEPLLRLVASTDEMAAALEELRSRDFSDGYQEMRWRASQTETWEARASAMVQALQVALSPTAPAESPTPLACCLGIP